MSLSTVPCQRHSVACGCGSGRGCGRVPVSRVRVHRLAAISASGRERASVRACPASRSRSACHPPQLQRRGARAPVQTIRHGESAERSARLPHLMSVGRLCQGGQWPMCARPASRLLWCAPLSERGVVQHWGSKSWQWHVRASACPVVLVLIQVWQWQQWQWHLHLHLHMHHQMYMHVHMYMRKYKIWCANTDANTLPKLVFASKYAAQACICMQIHANTAIRFFVFAPVFARRKYNCKYVHQCNVPPRTGQL